MSERTTHDSDPLNAEPALTNLVDTFITPESKLFDRNHGDIPSIDSSTHRIYFEAQEDLGVKLSGFSIGMPELYKSASEEVIAALQCAGNRRSEFQGLDEHKEAEGLPWGAGTVG